MAFLPPPALICYPYSSPSSRSLHHRSPPRASVQTPSPRDQLYSVVTSAKTRTQASPQLDSLIHTLESLAQTKTASSPYLIGTWRNLYTSTPSTSSIIQRTIVSSAFVPRVEQVIHPDDDNRPSKILNRVDLRAPLGCILNVRAVVQHIDTTRLSIRFDRAWFEFDRLPSWLGAAQLPTVVHLPYPVPFRLLGEKACGWLDVTYLDSSIRISRGNKGSCFVLVKDHHDSLQLTKDALT